jgi:hypothetical protein
MNEGKKDRRDPIRTIKPRNPVAKNASAAIGGGGAGAHKDKKKAMKQGDVKHKGKEYAEHLNLSLKKAISESEQQYAKFRVGQRATFQSSNGQEFPVIVTKVDYDDDAVTFKHANNKPFPNGELEQEVDPGWRFLTPDRSYDPNSLVKATSRESIDSDEYNDEAGMADNNLETMKRAVQGIDELIGAGDNLPEWCQEKIAVAKSMLVTVWDYMRSEQDRGAVSEGLRNPKDNPCWKGYKPVGTKKKGGRTVPNCVPKEGWTHDSLAAQLFETENTYEDRLKNLLNKKLGK